MADNIEVRQLYENRLMKLVNMNMDHPAWKGSQGGHWFANLMEVGDIQVPGGKEIARIENVIQDILKGNTDPEIALKVVILMKHFHRKWVEEVTKGNVVIDTAAKFLDALIGGGDLGGRIKEVNKAGGSDIWKGYRKQWNVACKKTETWQKLYESIIDDE